MSANAALRSLPLLALFATSIACSAKLQPAIDTEHYGRYRNVELTALREGVLGFFPGRPSGADHECFAGTEPTKVVHGLSFGARSPRDKGMELVRQIKAGERIRVHEIVYIEKVPGLWADAVLLDDDQPCIISADRGLRIHLLMTEQEKQQWEELPEALRQVILDRGYIVGMSREQVLMSLGTPYKQILAQGKDDKVTETWVYQSGRNRLTYLMFQGDELVGWRE